MSTIFGYHRGHRYNLRDNKVATGVSKTLAGRKVKDELLPLVVHGTFAEFPIKWLHVRKKVCPCCGHKTGKLELSDHGKRLLERKRRARDRASRIA